MNDFLKFMQDSVTVFHACSNVETYLIANDYIKLEENTTWKIEYNKKYYIKRNDTAIFAIKTPSKKNTNGLNITTSHLDSPTFKVKPNSKLKGEHVRLNIEAYGGPILPSWLDKPLSIGGRVIIKENNKLVSKLVYIDKDLLIIPNLPPHLNPSVSKGNEYSISQDILPLMSLDKDTSLEDILAKELNIDKSNILDYDIFLVNRQRASIGGSNDEFIFSPQLDDLASAYSCLQGFLNSKSDNFNIYIAFDNEEVGSLTKQGAASTFFLDCLNRILNKLSYTEEDKNILLANSFMLSCDNAHALNINKPNFFDYNNRPLLGKGVVIKYNANQRYTTDAISGSYVTMLAELANIKVQQYSNKSDLRGGSTLGALLIGQCALNSADIGLPQLAMHSSLEVIAKEDLSSMTKLIETFYNEYFNKYI